MAGALTSLNPASEVAVEASRWLAPSPASIVLMIDAIASVPYESDCQLFGSRLRGQDQARGNGGTSIPRDGTTRYVFC